MSFLKWINNKTMVHTCNVILLIIKNKWTIKPWEDRDESLIHIEVKEANLKIKYYTLYHSDYISSRKGKPIERVELSGCRKGGGELNRVKHRGFTE